MYMYIYIYNNIYVHIHICICIRKKLYALACMCVHAKFCMHTSAHDKIGVFVLHITDWVTLHLSRDGIGFRAYLGS